MRFWSALLAVTGAAAAGVSFQTPAKAKPNPQDWTLIVSGDTDGYLAPCGCTAPMTGGIKRRATLVRQLQAQGKTVYLDTGGLGGEAGRQGELKAETMAQALVSLDAAAIHLTSRDWALGRGSVSSLVNLAGKRLVSTDPGAKVLGIPGWVERGPFVIGGVSMKGEKRPDEPLKWILRAAHAAKKTPVVMVEGEHDDAVAIAKKISEPAVVIFRRNGWPLDRAEQVGKVVLLSPGERGKSLVRIGFNGKRFYGYAAQRLGPEFADDATVSRYYKTYLRRVDSANLLDRVPRLDTEAFAGSSACAPCHESASAVWSKSGHAHALATLEGEGHGRDPDCVPCHVTALTSQSGFRSRISTPDFAFVGCESCHGPAGEHVRDPRGHSLPTLGQKVCANCHTADQSPRFSFSTYWQKIAHK